MGQRDHGWIITASGRKFWPFDPRPGDIDIEDIAHHLSMITRWTGAAKARISVAEHSVRVATTVPQRYRLEALLHDAAEAYLGDVARPVKALVPAFAQAEARLMVVISQKFRLEYPMPDEVYEADHYWLRCEGIDNLCGPHVREVFGDTAGRRQNVSYGWDAEWAKKAFLNEYESLKRV